MIEAFSLFPNEFIGVSGGSFDHFQESNAFENPEFPDTSTGIEFGLFPPENSTQNGEIKTQNSIEWTDKTQDNFTGAVIPAALVALDIATVANIFAKVAVSGQPLDTFDLVTLGLVGIANAGGIARALKPVLKPNSPLIKIQSDLDANIARLGEEGSAGRAKIKLGIEGLTNKIKGNERMGIMGSYRQIIIERLKPKKVWSMLDDVSKLTDEEIRVVYQLSDPIESIAKRIPTFKPKIIFESTNDPSLMSVLDGNIIINKALIPRDELFAKAFAVHEGGHFAHYNPLTGKSFTWQEILTGFDTPYAKAPAFNGVEKDVPISKQIIADKFGFADNPVARKEFSEWVRNIGWQEYVKSGFSKFPSTPLLDFKERPELIRLIVYAEKYDKGLATMIRQDLLSNFQEYWVDDLYNIVASPFLKYGEGVIIKI